MNQKKVPNSVAVVRLVLKEKKACKYGGVNCGCYTCYHNVQVDHYNRLLQNERDRQEQQKSK